MSRPAACPSPAAPRVPNVATAVAGMAAVADVADVADGADGADVAAARLQVRRARVDDAEAFARMLSDPEVFPQLLQMPYANTETWRARLAESLAPGKSDLMLLAVTEDGEVAGGAGLHPVAASPRRRHAMALGMQVRPEWQGQGVGALLMQSLCDYADRWLGLLRLELEVYTDNLRAQALYRRFGFVDEGVRRCFALRDGEYVDALAMGRLNPSPLRGFARG